MNTINSPTVDGRQSLKRSLCLQQHVVLSTVLPTRQDEICRVIMDPCLMVTLESNSRSSSTVDAAFKACKTTAPLQHLGRQRLLIRLQQTANMKNLWHVNRLEPRQHDRKLCKQAAEIEHCSLLNRVKALNRDRL